MTTNENIGLPISAKLAPRPADRSGSGKESADDYQAVIAVLNARWRVIECRDGIQWILQGAKLSGHGAAWRGRSYCRTREALLRVCAQHTGKISPVAQTVLQSLPNRIGGDHE